MAWRARPWKRRPRGAGRMSGFCRACAYRFLRGMASLLRTRRAPVPLDDGAREIHLAFARYADAMKFHGWRVERLGRVEPHLRADAIARGGVELRPQRVRDHDEILVGLEPRGDGPFHFGRVVDVDVLVDDDHLLDVIVRREGAQDDVLGF